jgi:hypothetical protein
LKIQCKRGVVLSAIAFAIALLAVSSLTAGETYTIEVPDGYDDAGVKKTIWTVVTKRGWSINSHSNGYLQCALDHRGTQSVVTFRFDAEEIEFGHVSVGWNQVKRFVAGQMKRTGRVRGPVTPTRWLENIKRDIPREFGLNATAMIPGTERIALPDGGTVSNRLVEAKRLFEAGLITEPVYEELQMDVLKGF